MQNEVIFMTQEQRPQRPMFNLVTNAVHLKNSPGFKIVHKSFDNAEPEPVNKVNSRKSNVVKVKASLSKKEQLKRSIMQINN